ncbi:SgcJ/EcaC family oxidoreductase [Methylobacterium oxalidis]|uniref:SgcJ/EcaC family oxidoreductase n=1 Tax=Methylobacterium oxalidis TaxID=944322 RepID=UPI003315CCA9
MRSVLLMLALLLTSSSAANADDNADVKAAMNAWRSGITEACSKDVSHILSLYAEDAVLWGTLSQTIRSDRAGLRDYFVNACKKLPKLSAEFKDPLIRVYGDTAINSGYYTFSYEKDGQMVQLPARYSFTYVKNGGKWLIVDHHSSAMPK